MATPPFSNDSLGTRTSPKKFVDLKVYVPCVEVNGRPYISHNGEIFGPAQQAIGRQSRVHQDKDQLYQDDFSDVSGFRGVINSNDDIPQEEIQYQQSLAATHPNGNNETKNFDGSYQHITKSTAYSIPSSKPTTSKKRPIDSCPVQQQSPPATEPTRPKRRRIEPDTEQHEPTKITDSS
ncbi:hypothetical protein KCU92_g3889, partial [Aureobasidium melanogenum]